jgi:multidrug transporter EmrE-like cation transporter
MPYVLLLSAVAVNALANVLLKMASAKGVSWSLEGGLLALVARNGLLLVALAVFAANVLLYFAALRSLPLSVAYPIMVAGTFVLVNGAGALMLREAVAPAQLLGYLLIVLGVALVLAKKAAV